MMSRNQPRQTKEEAQRNKIIKAKGCVLTWAKFGEKKYAEIHHITMPGKRLGHWYTIPLSPWYHRGTCDPGKTKDEMRAKYGASLADGKRAFVASHHYTELELWQKLQVILGLNDELPKSKRVPRREYATAEMASDLVDAGKVLLPGGALSREREAGGQDAEASGPAAPGAAP